MPEKQLAADQIPPPAPAPPGPHKDTHKSGGSDAFTAADLLEAVVKRVRESGGAVDLTFGAVADGQYIRRSGTSMIGDTPSSAPANDTISFEKMKKTVMLNTSFSSTGSGPFFLTFINSAFTSADTVYWLQITPQSGPGPGSENGAGIDFSASLSTNIKSSDNPNNAMHRVRIAVDLNGNTLSTSYVLRIKVWRIENT